MNFQPELAEKVLRGEKTVTRRLANDNPRSPWYVWGCSLRAGQDYAVCPGRGKHAICRVEVVGTIRQPLGELSNAEARLEGFVDKREFREVWERINGSYDPGILVWRVEFKLVQGSSRTVGQEDR
jgi:hypothetical protein